MNEIDKYDRLIANRLPCDCGDRDGRGGHFSSCAAYWRDEVAELLREQGAEIKRLRMENASLKSAQPGKGEIAMLKAQLANRCDECGARIYSGPPDCPTCGAPNCCQRCCTIDHLKTQLADAEKRGLEKAIRVSILHECHASHICRCWFEIEKLINAEIAKLEAK